MWAIVTSFPLISVTKVSVEPEKPIENFPSNCFEWFNNELFHQLNIYSKTFPHETFRFDQLKANPFTPRETTTKGGETFSCQFHSMKISFLHLFDFID